MLFLSKSLNQEQYDSPDLIILYICTLLSFISVDILLAKVFSFLVFCLVVRNNPCGNSLSRKFFLVILNVVPVLFFTVDFNLFSCVFVTLTPASS